MKKIAISDLTQIHCLSDLAFSPDGKYSAFCLHDQSEKDNDYKSYIYLRNNASGETKRITHSGKESGFIWDDAHTLLFAAQRTDEDKAEPFHEKTCFYRLDVNGGEAYKAFDMPLNVNEIKKLPGGKYCLGVRIDLNALDPDKTDKQTLEDIKDYMVFEEVPYRANGRGEVSRIRNALFVFDTADGKCDKITPDFFNVGGWDVQGSKIAYCGTEYDAMLTLYGEVRVYDVDSADTVNVVAPDTMKVSRVMFVDGSLLIAASDMIPYGMGQMYDLYRCSPEGSALTKVWDAQFTLGDDILFDCSRGGGMDAVAVGDALYLIGMDKYNDSIYRFGVDNKMEKVVDFTGYIGCMDAREGEIQFMASPANGLSELFAAKNGAAKKLTAFNDEYLAERYVARAHYIPFTDSDGVDIDGWILLPENFDANKTYPGVLEIHGGPRCAYGIPFFHEMQVFVARGCAVFFCNPRGSEGYGEDFADLRGKYGTVDYTDLMEFTDHVLKLYPNIDASRLGAAGGSYGGFMCNWIEGHTDRFAAIASQRSISNWIADFGGSEIGFTFDRNEMAADPWTDVLKVWEQSPLKYANNAKTPILFIHSECDYNCSLDQGLEMFAAMKAFGVPSRMCVFKGENHSLSRSGKPRHRMRRLKEMCDWFEKYLKL